MCLQRAENQPGWYESVFVSALTAVLRGAALKGTDAWKELGLMLSLCIRTSWGVLPYTTGYILYHAFTRGSMGHCCACVCGGVGGGGGGDVGGESGGWRKMLVEADWVLWACGCARDMDGG